MAPSEIYSCHQLVQHHKIDFVISNDDYPTPWHIIMFVKLNINYFKVSYKLVILCLFISHFWAYIQLFHLLEN
jgi:hypothetical protein